MAEETAPESEHDVKPGPPRMNGPAFFAFGLVFLVLGVAVQMNLLIVVGALATLVGVWAILRLRRYEKAHGIEETLPGRPPSASAQAAEEEKARALAQAQESLAESSEDPGTTSPDS